LAHFSAHSFPTSPARRCPGTDDRAPRAGTRPRARVIALGRCVAGPPTQCHLYPLNRLHAEADADPAGKLTFRPHGLPIWPSYSARPSLYRLPYLDYSWAPVSEPLRGCRARINFPPPLPRMPCMAEPQATPVGDKILLQLVVILIPSSRAPFLRCYCSTNSCAAASSSVANPSPQPRSCAVAIPIRWRR
jgi:hypothetical protein